MEDGKVLYIRHNGLGREITDYLFSNKLIGVHFANVEDKNRAFDRDSYSLSSLQNSLTTEDLHGYNEQTAKTAISHLKDCSEQRRLVVASYEGYKEIYIGVSIIGNEVYWGRSGRDGSTLLQMKCVKLQITDEGGQKIKIDDFPMVFLNPPPYLTIVEWSMGKKAVNEYFYSKLNKTLPRITSGLFSSAQLEVLCEEWLRENKKLTKKLFKTGGSMKDFDIVGINSDGKYIAAQVKFKCTSDNIKSFLEKQYFQGETKFFFTNDPIIDDNQVVSFDTVIEYFKNNNNDYLFNLAFGNNLEQFQK